ncbi:aspartate/glutamate racemase family protein [Bradyrhizobium sp. Ai1a-2]|uniref:aspartate/glutamate racemase family protein n=1 Tax=Bradyrhizobium sp. Ai1a-2 TaxID=196490 RepID=UPI00040523DC|nr:aspartate/glutamate racemase family protein [Bradyrhizobium sp. Ai1a-2]
MPNKRILVILPVNNPGHGDDVMQELASAVAPDFELVIRRLSEGTPFIESRHDEAVNAAPIIELAKTAEREGFSGVFVNCFGEPAVDVVRELVTIPVVGGFRPAVLAAKLVAQTYSIVTITRSVAPIIRGLAASFGIEPVSIRDIGMHVVELHDKEQLVRKLLDQCMQAIATDGAEAIVLGCTGMIGVSETIASALAAAGRPAPVINPARSAITFLQAQIRMEVSSSRLTYAKPMDMRELMFRLHHHGQHVEPQLQS